MSKPKKIKKIFNFLNRQNPLAVLAVLFLLEAVFVATSYHLIFWNRIYPNIMVANINLTGKTELEAQKLLASISPSPTITLITPDKQFVLKSRDIDLQYDTNQTVRQAFLIGRSESAVSNFTVKWQALQQPVQLPFAYSYNQERLTQFFQKVSNEIDIPVIQTSIEIQKGQVIVKSGQAGLEVDKEILAQNVKNALGAGQHKIAIPVKTNAVFSASQIEELRTRTQNLVGASLAFTQEENNVILSDSDLVKFLAPDQTFNQNKIKEQVEKIAAQFYRPVQEPTFRFENGKVTEFKPAKDGIEVDKEKLIKDIATTIDTLTPGQKVPMDIPVTKTKSKLTTNQVNNIGLNELIGRGWSQFKGSAPARVHNIALAASKLNGILIKPGEVFSFNQALGDVSVFTGFQQAYIIKNGRTILGDGGGVCQVSSTLFRAALAAGLPIIERRAHSFRVSYYEQNSTPGFDATVFDPSPDFKIKNDTPAYILLQATVDTKNASLVFEIYGTSDGRVATTSKPRVWDIKPPPPDLYQDDPTLPTGTVKQVEHRVNGAKVAFDYKVIRGGGVLQDKTFYSTYQPWQAVYLRGTAQ